MLSRIYHYLKEKASKRLVLILLGLSALHVVAFAWRTQLMPEGVTLLDGRIFTWYGEKDVVELFESLSEKQKALYCGTELTIDVSFPIVYSGLFALAVIGLWKKELAIVFLAVVSAGLLCDLAENILIAIMLLNQAAITTLAPLSSGFTFAKWTAITSNLLLLAVGAVWNLLGNRQPAH